MVSVHLNIDGRQHVTIVFMILLLQLIVIISCWRTVIQEYKLINALWPLKVETTRRYIIQDFNKLFVDVVSGQFGPVSRGYVTVTLSYVKRAFHSTPIERKHCDEY